MVVVFVDALSIWCLPALTQGAAGEKQEERGKKFKELILFLSTKTRKGNGKGITWCGCRKSHGFSPKKLHH